MSEEPCRHTCMRACRIFRQKSRLTKGTKQLVEVTSLPFFWEGDIQDVVSFRLHCRWGQKKKIVKGEGAAIR